MLSQAGAREASGAGHSGTQEGMSLEPFSLSLLKNASGITASRINPATKLTSRHLATPGRIEAGLSVSEGLIPKEDSRGVTFGILTNTFGWLEVGFVNPAFSPGFRSTKGLFKAGCGIIGIFSAVEPGINVSY